MADISLKDRLLEHAKAFDGLLSLIPAKYYYGEDNSNQWKKKKQTKGQASAAQRAKLDPDSIKSAKDVMDERARKRKLEEFTELNDDVEIEGVKKELPKQSLEQKKSNTGKKLKIANGNDRSRHLSDGTAETLEKRRLKREKKREKGKAKKLANKKKNFKECTSKDTGENVEVKSKEDISILSNGKDLSKENTNPEEQCIPIASLENEPSSPVSLKSPTPTFEAPTEPSSNTSTSSTVPPGKAPKHIKLPTDPDLLRSRLAARIDALRAARKADGPDGRPARNRHELLEARRKKEDQRRAHKKELRLKAKAEEEAKREAAIVSARNSPGTGLVSTVAENVDQKLSFGRIAFDDGQQLTDDLSGLKEAPKKRGPQDTATALIASENKQKKIAGFDEEKRANIEEKDLWINAKKRVYGEKLHDNPSLLKKTLKRKEKAKKKSEKEWTERKDGVAKGQAIRQKKREENLKSRRDGKSSINGKDRGSGKHVKSKKSKIKSRPGFEGSFTSMGKKFVKDKK